MAKHESKSAIDRGLLLLNLLDSTQRTRKQIHQMLVDRGYDISEKSIERDLNRLVDLFPRHVSYIKKFPPYGYRLREASKMSLMTPEEAISVLTAFEYLDPLLPKLAESLNLYIKEAEQVLSHNFASNYDNWKNKISIKNEGFQLQHKEINKAVLNNLHTALLKGILISPTYCPRKTGKSKKYEKLYPIGLVHSGRLLYLIGSHDEKATKRFFWPLNRFKKIDVIEENNPLSSEKVRDHEEILGFSFSEQNIRIVLKFEKNAGFILKETPTSKKMRLDEHEDSIIIEDVLDNTLELENWIIGFGEKVEVMEPKKLRDKIKERLRSAAKNYE
jgi:predicted DNA-binding transcriptional regulator YafY